MKAIPTPIPIGTCTSSSRSPHNPYIISGPQPKEQRAQENIVPHGETGIVWERDAENQITGAVARNKPKHRKESSCMANEVVKIGGWEMWYVQCLGFFVEEFFGCFPEHLSFFLKLLVRRSYR